MKPWANWSGSVSFQPSQVTFPSTEAEIQKIVRECRASHTPLRLVGAGHSFTPLIQTSGVLMSLDNYTGLVRVDGQIATVRAGTRLRELGKLLHQKNLAMENLGDIDSQSLAGAISTGTHGTGLGFGSLSTQVDALTLITADGERLEITAQRDPHLFKAAQLSLGVLGVITEVRLRCVPAYRLKMVKRRQTLEELVPQWSKLARENRTFEFFWFPYTNFAVAKRGGLTDAPAGNTFLRFFNNIFLENYAFKIVSEVARRVPVLCQQLCKLEAALSGGEQTDVDFSHLILPTARYVRFNEMEYAFEAKGIGDVIAEVQAHLLKHFYATNFPIEVRFGRSEDIYLSPAYQWPPAFLAVHVYRGMDFRKFFGAMESIFRNHRGRPHWGKIHTRTAEEFADLYPMWNRFLQIRNQLDPQGLFLNEYLSGIFSAKSVGKTRTG